MNRAPGLVFSTSALCLSLITGSLAQAGVTLTPLFNHPVMNDLVQAENMVLPINAASGTLSTNGVTSTGNATSRCVTPKIPEEAKNTPVKVYIDQERQIISIMTPDRKDLWHSRISSGGGLKIPNGQFKKDPYCARTPEIPRKIIPLINAKDFDPATCTEEQIRTRATVFDMYYSRTFTDNKGNMVPMPRAIRLLNGIFAHRVARGYEEFLGTNVSGECIRLNDRTSKFLFDQMLKYKGIEVVVGPPPKSSKCKANYCDESMIAKAKADLAAGKIPRTRYGSEDVTNPGDFFQNISCNVGSMFEKDTRDSRPAPDILQRLSGGRQ